MPHFLNFASDKHPARIKISNKFNKDDDNRRQEM